MSNIQDKKNKYYNLQTVYNNYCKLNKTQDTDVCIQRKKLLNTLKEEINKLQKQEDEKLAKIQRKKRNSWFSFVKNDNGSKKRSRKRRSRKDSKKRSRKGSKKRRSRKGSKKRY